MAAERSPLAVGSNAIINALIKYDPWLGATGHAGSLYSYRNSGAASLADLPMQLRTDQSVLI